MQILIDRLRSVEGGRILDVATGRGNFISLLQQGLKSYNEIIAIDTLDAEKLKTFEEGFADDRVKFIHMDAADMSFQDSYFDMVCISNSLHHLKESKPITDEMLRVLKPGGVILINEMICDNQSPSQMTYVLMHHWWGKIDTALGKLHDPTFPKRKVIDTAVNMGLKDIEILESNDPDNPMDKESLESISKIIDEYIDRAKPLENFEAFRQEGEEIRRHLYEFGVNGATQVIIIGKK